MPKKNKKKRAPSSAQKPNKQPSPGLAPSRAHKKIIGDGRSISLCMIAKNEAEWIGECIRSVLPIVDEVILVDTGSTDATIEIVESFGGQVYHRPWDDDFAAPRNLSIEKATGDWILILDADERIAERDLAALKALTADRSICWEFLQRHYTNDPRLSDFTPCKGEFPEFERGVAGYFESNCVRFFPNGDGLNYQGRVHELVEHSIRQIGRHKVVRTPIRIQHYGHTKVHQEKRDKSSQYLNLGIDKIKDDPSYWQAYFELGVEANINKDYPRSIEAFKKAIRFRPTYLPAYVNLGYVYCECTDYASAELILKQALEIDPRSDEAYCNLAVVYMRSRKLSLAEECLRRALLINPTYANAMSNLGKTLALQKRYAEAAQIYRRLLDLLPGANQARAELGALYLLAGVPDAAERYLLQVADVKPPIAAAIYHLGLLYQSIRDNSKAKQFLEQYVALNPQSPEEQPSLAQARMALATL
jgi:tetratricopeptide (TPR) repeat protein